MALQIGIVIFTSILFISSVQGISDSFNVTQRESPYYARIDVYIGSSPVASCSGALISPYLVITSYSCISRWQSFYISFGCIETDEECKRVSSSKFFVPPEAITSTPSTIYNYVAMLLMDESITYNDYIQSVSFRKTKTNLNFANVYGNLETDKGWHVQGLHMKILNISECTDHFTNDSLQYSLCARGEDRYGNKRGKLCSAGNALLVRNNKFLIGILKESHKCENELNLFIDVQIFASWINYTLFNVKVGLSQQNATKNEFSYHAHIEVYHHEGRINNCSGAVISSKFVISTKYCMVGGTDFIIKLGSLNPYNADDKPAYDHATRYSAVSMFRTMEQSLALLKLETEIIFNERIQPIPLPKPGEMLFSHGEFYYFGIATGYFSDVMRNLQWATTRIFPVESCHLYRHLEPNMVDGSLCVLGKLGIEEDNLCNDEGAPLVTTYIDRKALVGISVGSRGTTGTCMSRGEMSLFIDVQKQVDWLTTAMYGTLEEV